MTHHLVENNRHLLLNATYYTISAGLKQPLRGQASRWRYENGYSLIQVVYPAGHMQRNKPQCSLLFAKLDLVCTSVQRQDDQRTSQHIHFFRRQNIQKLDLSNPSSPLFTTKKAGSYLVVTL